MPFLALAWKFIGIKGAIAIGLAVVCGVLYLSLRVQNARLESAQAEIVAKNATIASHVASFRALLRQVENQNASITEAEAAANRVKARAAAERARATVEINRLRGTLAELEGRVTSAEADAKTARDAADEIRALLLKERTNAE